VDVYKLGVIHPRLEFAGVEIFTTFWFLWHNFGSRYARKPIKSSKVSDDSLVSTINFSEKIGSLDWRPGPHKVGHQNAKDTPLMMSHQRTLNAKRIFFFNLN